MKPKKDISELIRESAHKLDQRPSKKAWKRLENRLDEAPGEKRRFSIRSLFSIAATMVGLVGLASVISFMFQQQDNVSAVNDVAPADHFFVEKLETVSDEEQGFYRVVEFQNRYQDRLSNPSFKEGKRKNFAVAKFVKNSADPGSQSSNTSIRQSKQARLTKALSGFHENRCIESAVLHQDKVIVTYFEHEKDCKALTYNHGQKTTDEVKYWRLGKEDIENALIKGSLKLLINLDFAERVEINIPTKGAAYSINISKPQLVAFTGKPIAALEKELNTHQLTSFKKPAQKAAYLKEFVTITRR